MNATITEALMFDVWKAANWREAEAIPAAKVLICWKNQHPGGVMDVLVMPFPNDRHYFDHYCDETSGACYSDWLQPGRHTMTPENVFGEMAISIGFANSAAAEKAIIIFARVKECDWARKMLASDSYARLQKANLTAPW